jgi:hypothetical protein
MTREKLLDKLAKMKRHADSAAALGSEAEATAFAEAINKMLLEHKLEMSDIEFAEYEKAEPVIKKVIRPTEHDIREVSNRVVWQERLAGIVARAHFCRILVHPGSNRITLVGRAEDIAVAEYLYVTIVRTAESLAKKAHGKYYRECFKRDGHGQAAAGFKESFFQAFIVRLAQRLEELKAQAAATTSTALVRIEKSMQAVNDFMSQGKYGTASALQRLAASHRDGLAEGRKAADAVNLQTRGVTTGAKVTGLIR